MTERLTCYGKGKPSFTLAIRLYDIVKIIKFKRSNLYTVWFFKQVFIFSCKFLGNSYQT
jgi:hypothetical protein